MSESSVNPVVQVAVSVKVDADGSVHIVCQPDPANVNQTSTLLAFNLDTSTGFQFRTANAIVLAESDPDFPFPSWTLSPSLATLFDLCNTTATFKYSVYVVDTRTGLEYSVDPAIKNGGATGS